MLDRDRNPSLSKGYGGTTAPLHQNAKTHQNIKVSVAIIAHENRQKTPASFQTVAQFFCNAPLTCMLESAGVLCQLLGLIVRYDLISAKFIPLIPIFLLNILLPYPDPSLIYQSNLSFLNILNNTYELSSGKCICGLCVQGLSL